MWTRKSCPSCGGAIVGAVDEHCQCRYCGNIVMGTIRKKQGGFCEKGTPERN
ncbi:MAG: hypothetical protein NC409_06795 [Clostridium sp.]|nr:hypothetical protein [Clostridium sp.]